MTDLMNYLLAPVLVSSLLLAGCEGGDPHGDHDHDHEGHDHADHDGHDHGNEGDDEPGADTSLGEVEIAGSVLHVAVGAEPAPNVTLHLHLELKSGPAPAAVRVWVGDESASGAVKGKATGSDGKYHADAVCPAELADDALLWIEVERDSGEREAKSLQLVPDRS